MKQFLDEDQQAIDNFRNYVLKEFSTIMEIMAQDDNILNSRIPMIECLGLKNTKDNLDLNYVKNIEELAEQVHLFKIKFNL